MGKKEIKRTGYCAVYQENLRKMRKSHRKEVMTWTFAVLCIAGVSTWFTLTFLCQKVNPAYVLDGYPRIKIQMLKGEDPEMLMKNVMGPLYLQFDHKVRNTDFLRHNLHYKPTSKVWVHVPGESWFMKNVDAERKRKLSYEPK